MRRYCDGRETFAGGGGAARIGVVRQVPIAFTTWGYEVTYLELASVVLALIAIGLGIRGNRWTWPMWLVASALYAWLFTHWHLYASAGMQFVFMAAAVWGWFAWGPEGVIAPGRLTARVRVLGVPGLLIAWLALVPLLREIGGAAPVPDAFIFVGSLAAQLLMVFEKVENWPMWLSVNLVGVVLYASQSLYFTAGFYAVLVVMAAIGWHEWRIRSKLSAAQPLAVQDV